ncbi:MAG: DUF2061 domain-containing protein [Rhodobacteraceae bacterium]|nr:DUF2061 domain-containing protein [Paracoccaceae bacterium]
MDSKQRSIAKAVIWQAIGLISMTLIGFLITGSAWSGGALALVNAAIGLALYLAYELVWARIRWGIRLPTGRERE